MYSSLSSSSTGRPSATAHDATGSIASTTWDTLRKQARSFESEIESKLVNYSRLGVSENLGGMTEQAELELEDLLRKVCVDYASILLLHHIIC